MKTEKADIITTVALMYDGENAPTITAKGSGHIGAEILRIAEENNIPLHEDAELVQLLSQLELGDEIPRALYITIAQVIAFAYIISGKHNNQL